MSATDREMGGCRLAGRADVLICGASFAGLAAARELAGSGADVLVLDRYEIGERPTSACGDPDRVAAGAGADRASSCSASASWSSTPRAAPRSLDLPYTFSTFDYDEMCELLWRECDAELRDRDGRPGRGARRRTATATIAVETDRGTVSAPLVVDALGWRRMLAAGDGFQPVEAPLTRALEVHPAASSDDLEVWVDRRYVRAGYGWSLPGRRGAADRRLLLRPARPRPRGDRPARRRPRPRAGPLPGQLDPAQAAPPDRRRRLLRRRLGRPVPAADRGGDQDRALLRHRRRPRAARRLRGPAEPRAGAAALRRASTTPTERASAAAASSSG